MPTAGASPIELRGGLLVPGLRGVPKPRYKMRHTVSCRMHTIVYYTVITLHSYYRGTTSAVLCCVALTYLDDVGAALEEPRVHPRTLAVAVQRHACEARTSGSPTLA